MPQLMRTVMALSGDWVPPREAVLDELRAMLRHHREWPGLGRTGRSSRSVSHRAVAAPTAPIIPTVTPALACRSMPRM